MWNRSENQFVTLTHMFSFTVRSLIRLVRLSWKHTKRFRAKLLRSLIYRQVERAAGTHEGEGDGGKLRSLNKARFIGSR